MGIWVWGRRCELLRARGSCLLKEEFAWTLVGLRSQCRRHGSHPRENSFMPLSPERAGRARVREEKLRHPECCDGRCQQGYTTALSRWWLREGKRA